MNRNPAPSPARTSLPYAQRTFRRNPGPPGPRKQTQYVKREPAVMMQMHYSADFDRRRCPRAR